MLCFCESASIQTSRLYDRTFHPSLCLQAGLNLTHPRLKGVSFRPCFKVSWVLSFFQLGEPTWLTRPTNLISISYRISSLFLLTAGRKIHMALTRASLKSLHALTVSLAWAVLATLPQHVSSLCTETSNLSRLHLKCPSFPLLFSCLLLLWNPALQLLLRWHFLFLHFLYIPSLLNSSSQSIKKFI